MVWFSSFVQKSKNNLIEGDSVLSFIFLVFLFVSLGMKEALIIGAKFFYFPVSGRGGRTVCFEREQRERRAWTK
jgi:hypothetical protein